MISVRWVGDGWLYAMEFRLKLRKFQPQAGLESGTASLAGWLVVWVERSFETLFQSIGPIGPSLREGGRKRSEKIEESQNVQTPLPPAPTARAIGPCHTIIQISMTSQP